MFIMKSSETTNILGSVEPIWEFSATPKKIFSGFTGDTCKEKLIDGYCYKLTLRQTTGINNPDKIFKDILHACGTLGSLYSYVGPLVESTKVEPVKASYIWDGQTEYLPKFMEFLSDSLSINCVLLGIISVLNKQKEYARKGKRK